MGRIVWVDWAKALLIIFMVIGHYSSPNILKEFIYTFHMPAFFIISGYLYKPKNFIRTFFSFIIPMFFWGLILCVFYYFINIMKDLSNPMPVENLIQIPMMCSGAWFIRSLILCRFVSGDILGRFVPYRILGGVFLSFLAIILDELFSIRINVEWLRLLYYCYPFFAVGYFLNRINYNPTSYNPMYIIALLVYVSMTFVQGRCGIAEFEYGYSYFLYYIVAVITSLLFFHICTMFKKNRLIEDLSIGTLVILGLHRMPGVLYGLSNGHPLSWVASTIVTIIVGIMFIRIIGKKYPILMGKLSSNFCIYSFRFKKLFFLC